MEITPRGIIMPTAADIKVKVTEDWKAALGQEMNTSEASPQGQLIASEAAIIADKNAQLLQLQRNIDPRTAAGVWQDAIGALYGMERHGAEPSIVQLDCHGGTGTYLPSKAELSPATAESASGDIFVCVAGGTIPASGMITLAFESQESGAIPVNIGTVNKIYKAIAGWDSVNNSEAGIIGRLVETRAEFERRRKRSTAKNSQSMLESIESNVADLDGVIDARAWENNEDIAASPIGSAIILKPHSVYVCVAGGDPQEIAETILYNKSDGAATNGNIERTVPNGGGNYIIRYQEADPFPVAVQVQVRNSTPDIIKDIVYRGFYGTLEDDSAENVRVGIGSTLWAARFYGPLAAAGVHVISVRVAPKGGGYNDYLQTEINQLATLDMADIDVGTP